ncbi:helix-turn-helix domain-containing protein [Oceanobacillus halophilus]|uniref:Helicase Helix-turn-helix domain-containing protein n=1 Tax=Oceanobacillus halophilus TaxID=930130 RepID=A0A495ACJ5_9BACI|nr:helix-turn-helix domain-containing protein [Oceanobacillus halophilus]RKQ37691.1 hypothetical protein D8M06_02485 [Oceanobacillus halophilus]
MILKWILLTCYKHLNGERTTSSIFHLLKGKRSIQTVQDAHIYKLDQYYGIHKRIKKVDIDAVTQELLRAGYIQHHAVNESSFIITGPGIEWLEKHTIDIFFKGLMYYEKSDVFLDRLLLLIQTLTNSKENNFSFIPIVENPKVEFWVKQIYRKVKGKEASFLRNLYNELHIILNQFPDKEAEIFVDRLTAYKNFGLSLFQLAEKHQITEDDAHLVHTSSIHRILEKVENDSIEFPVLSLFLKGLSNEMMSQITISAKETYQLLQSGYTIEQIAFTRRLRENTINDHIVEIALYLDDFPIWNYVKEQEQTEILQAINQAKSHKLKEIKSRVSEHINYFQIRLVLAMQARLQKQGD